MPFFRKISRPKPAFLAILAFAILAFLAAMTIFLSQPRPVALTDPRSQEIAAVLQKAERLLDEVACNPAVNVNVLDEVLADWPFLHRPAGNARAMVVRVYGESAAASAGYLTDRKAFYLSMRGAYSGADATPENGLRPTIRPQVFCPTPAPDEVLSIESVAISEDRAVVRYRLVNYSLQEATLISVAGQWKIADFRYLERYN